MGTLEKNKDKESVKESYQRIEALKKKKKFISYKKYILFA